MPKHIYNVPEQVKLEAIKNLENATSNGKRKPNGAAQFEYDGTQFSLVKDNKSKHGYKVTPTHLLAEKTARRDKARTKPKLSEIEGKMVKNLYKIAEEQNGEQKRNGLKKLEVDHKYGSNSPHHPSFMGLMEKGENIRKSNKVGGKYNYYDGPYESKNSKPKPKPKPRSRTRAPSTGLVNGIVTMGPGSFSHFGEFGTPGGGGIRIETGLDSPPFMIP